MKTLTDLFRDGSKSFKTLNPQPKKRVSWVMANGMNKTEAEFALRLEAMKRNGEILRYEYEGITLRFAGVKYTPDFVVFERRDGVGDIDPIRLIEVKGAYTKGKFERAIERFRHARTYWPEFTFELWQKTKDGWGTPKI